MEVSRLARLLHADANEVEELITTIERADGVERSRLLERLSRVLTLEPTPDDGEPSRVRSASSREVSLRTDVANAVAADLGYD